MKLKKLMALALSGVLAVSMLAGCNNVSNGDENNGGDPVDPGVNGVSASVGALVKEDLGEDYPTYVTFADSAALDEDLQYAVEFAGVLDIMPQYVLCDTLTGVDNSIYSRLQTAVGDTGVFVNTIGDNDVLKAAENTSNTMDDAVAIDLRAISSAIGENAINQQVAEMVAPWVDEYLYSTEEDGSANGSNYNHEYTVSVSTYTKTVNSSIGGIIGTGVGAADPAVTFVAVQVVRTSTHQ